MVGTRFQKALFSFSFLFQELEMVQISDPESSGLKVEAELFAQDKNSQRDFYFSSSFLWNLKNIVTTLSKTVFFLSPQFYSQNLDQIVLNLALTTRADWSQQGLSLWGSRGLSLISPRLLITGGSPGHKGTSVHFPILCQ